jgi:hypothetical protein
MTFFYDLNKKLDEIRATPSTTHGQLNERDMGKHNNATTGFKAVADKAAKEYGSKAAGERVAGAVKAKMAKAGKLEEQDMDESLGSIVKKVGGAAKKVGGAVLNKLGHGSDEDMIRDLQKKVGMPQTGKKPMATPNEGVDKAAFAKLAPPKDKITFADKIAGAKKEVDEMLGDVAAEAIKGALSGKQKQLDKNNNGKLDANDFAMLRGGSGKTSKGGTVTKTKTGMKHSAGPGQYGGSDEESHVVDRLKGPSMKNLTGKQETDEGWDDMMKDVQKRAGERKIGTVTHGAKHDVEEIPGGRRVTRRVDPNTGHSVGADSDEPAAGEKRGRGRPKGPAKAPERVTAKAYKHKGGRKMADEEFDPADQGEYDQEGEAAKEDIHTIVRHAKALEKVLGDNDNLPEWVQAKLSKIEGMMSAVDDYMQNQKERSVEKATGEEGVELDEKAVSKKQQRFMGMVHATQKGEKAPSKEVAKVAKTMKKSDAEDFASTKHKGLPEKKKPEAKKEESKSQDKPKKVKEQGGTDTPTASSGFSFGQGIYDSMNRELETMIRESMNVNMSMNNDAHGGPSKSLTVTATDDDAMKLSDLLKNAGLGGEGPNVEGGAKVEVHGAEDLADQIRNAMGDHDHADGEVCDACGQEDCGCEEVDEAYGDDAVSQNSPDFPSNTETSHDAFQYSGGLNKPKSSGLATIPVTDVVADGEDEFGMPARTNLDLSRLREMAGIKEAKKDVEEEKTEEGNLFTGNLAKARADGKKEADLDGDGDMEKVKESIRDLTRRWNQFKG